MPFVFYLDAPSNVNERPAVIALTLTHTSPVAWEGAVRADDKHVIDVLVTHEEVAHDIEAALCAMTASSRTMRLCADYCLCTHTTGTVGTGDSDSESELESAPCQSRSQ